MKRSIMKRMLAMFLTLVMVFTMSGVTTLTAFAETGVADENLDVLYATEDGMKVSVNKTFPSAVKYSLADGTEFYGQTQQINTIEINGHEIVLDADDVTYEKTEGSTNKAVYTLTVKDDANGIDAVITAEIVVSEGNILEFAITDIKNNREETLDDVSSVIQTIAIPNHSLVSVRSSQEGANFKGATMSMNTHISGDEYLDVTESLSDETKDYIYGFVSNSELSAAIWSNSEHDGRAAYAGIAGGSKNTRVFYNVQTLDDGTKTMGLESAPWYYHRVVTDSKNVSYIVEETEMPRTRVIITDDRNDDAVIDWQDGAIAYRDIQHELYKSEEVPELVAYRIAMNFGGQAQNPFLTTLDNVKKISLHTDGLGQSVLLKGYGSEGHDSGHPDYANIGERIGGAEDMNYLLEKGAEYGAKFGIHINASEMYPEAEAFSDDSVRRTSDGALRYGWNWLDQGVGIDGIYDLATGNREARLDALKELVDDNLDFIYLDVWGNNTSSSKEDSWQTRKISKEIIDNGWRMTTEWGGANEYDSTFQHWAADLTYGGYNYKGENSEVMRFIHNHEKDSWVGDYPRYGGAANAPLLGGYNMKDFEGWQGRSDYNAYITNLYTHDVVTKFLQHYKAIKWVNGEPVSMSDNGGDYTWIPEMEITLKDEAGNVVVAKRVSNDVNSEDYRNRTITLNGKVVSTGIVSKGDGTAKGNETYLIPWVWDAATGELVDAADEKLYHWNTAGGTTTWELPDGWEKLETVKMYTLTDQGKVDEQTIEVKDGKVTLTAEAEVPYVVYKGAAANVEMQWSEGMHIVDAGFNDADLDSWNVEGEGAAEIVKSQSSNGMLKLTGDVAVSQKLTDLVEGQRYAVYVGVDNRSDAKAWLTLNADGEELDANYTEKSIALNYVKADPHSTNNPTVDGNSYFQNMYVYFTAPATEVTLTMRREAGEGDTYFDNIRIVASEADNITKDEDGNVVKFTQDFENSVQGVYPFVIGNIEGVEDNRTHLSELHAPYTQAGWDVKKLDDVIDGNWSLKVNGLCGYTYQDNGEWVTYARTGLIYQTVPQNFRFEPGVTYKVSFNYQAGYEGSYGVAIGDGQYNPGYTKVTPLAQTRDNENLGKDGYFEVEITGSLSGQTWIGVCSTGTPVDCEAVYNEDGATDDALNFGGYLDVVLDNLVIERVDEGEITKEVLTELLNTAKEMYSQDDYLNDDWTLISDAMDDAQVALDKDIESMDDIKAAYTKLKAVIAYMDSINTEETAGSKDDIPVDGVIVTAGDWDKDHTYGNAGQPEWAIDGNTGTAWMTSFARWQDCLASGDGWIDLQYPETHTVDGFRYLPTQQEMGGAAITVKDYEIWVKTADAQEDAGAEGFAALGYQKVAEGTLENTLTWKTIEFDAVENVTNVRFFVKSAQIHDWWATAAEVRAMSKAESVSGTTVDKSELVSLIEETDALNSGAYSSESWEYVQTKLEAAKAVAEKEDASSYDVKLAIANLEDAVDALEAVNPFKDIEETDWYYKAVLWGADKDIVAGIKEDMFYPRANCTRAQIVSFLWRAEGRPEPASAECKFTDVNSSKWYYKAVLWATENNVVAGYGDTLFAPNATCTRAEMATFIWRLEGEKEPASTDNPFNDVPAAKWYTKAAQWTYENDIVSGYDVDGVKSFAPKGTIARAETVTMIYRLYN